MEYLLRQEIELRICEESIPRIKKCLELVSESEVWKRPNEQSNSIGNLIQHLEGNVRQWLLKGLLGKAYNRNRDQEFSASTLVKKDLLSRLDILSADIQKQLQNLNPTNLQKDYNIQGIETTGFGICIHVVEHFSYHTGQIALLTKLFKNKDLGFYSNNSELNKQ